MDVELAQLTNVTSNSFEVLSSTDTVLLTQNNLVAGMNSIDLTSIPAVNTSIKLRWMVTHSGTPGGGGVVGARLASWRVVGESAGVTPVTVTPAVGSVNSGI